MGGAAWLAWLAGSIGLTAVEAATADFTFLMLAGGALAGAGASFFGAGFAVSATVASVVGVALLVFARPFLRRRFRPVRAGDIGAPALLGRPAEVLEVVDAQGGRVKLHGETWSARSADDREYPVGAPVRVVRIDGATAVVSAAERVDPS